MVAIDKVWLRIKAHEGETFHQIKGARFRYSVIGNAIKPDRTNRSISKCDFEKALVYVPLMNTVPLQRLQGPSYLYALLMDKRIRGSDW